MGFISWLEGSMLSCPYSKYLGIDCFGCGMQRAVVALLKGNYRESFYLYPALIPIIFMFLFLIAHLIFKFKNGAAWLTYNFIFVISIVVVSFLIQLI